MFGKKRVHVKNPECFCWDGPFFHSKVLLFYLNFILRILKSIIPTHVCMSVATYTYTHTSCIFFI